MGANQCKCECDDKSADLQNAGVDAKQSSYQETVETSSPTLGLAVEQRPPEQAGDEPDTKALEGKAEKQEQQSAVNADGTQVLKFNLESKKSLGARFAELRDPEPDGTLVASSISDRSALSQTVSGYRGVQAGDVVVMVNGEGGSRSHLLDCLTKAKNTGGPCEIVVRPRPATFDMTLQRTGDEKMGVVVAVHDDIPDRVEVRQVADEGAVPGWNEKNPKNVVVVGDWVMTVNGSNKPANDMIADMQEAWQRKQKLTLQVLSYPTMEMRERPITNQA
eukprot:TRINITY_DN113616_c0_g1_i1.p1 TRINITY_DN113616_c0_g1~~TRINITY_DN113616_c0_g1_i1.p1  ORF type:complete len:314 (-),score=91.86 TRINITY_DN113616_c0_g1_i1:283-1113(-)